MKQKRNYKKEPKMKPEAKCVTIQKPFDTTTYKYQIPAGKFFNPLWLTATPATPGAITRREYVHKHVIPSMKKAWAEEGYTEFSKAYNEQDSVTLTATKPQRNTNELLTSIEHLLIDIKDWLSKDSAQYTIAEKQVAYLQTEALATKNLLQGKEAERIKKQVRITVPEVTFAAMGIDFPWYFPYRNQTFQLFKQPEPEDNSYIVYNHKRHIALVPKDCAVLV